MGLPDTVEVYMATFYLKGKKYNCIKNGVPYFRKSAVIGGKQRSFYGDGEKDAQRKIDEAKGLEDKGLDFDKRSAKVGETFRHWLFDIKRMDGDLKASSFSTYESQYRKFIEDKPLGGIALTALSSGVMQAIFNSMYEDGGTTGKNIRYFLRLMKQFCKWAVSEGYLVKNPCDGVTVPGDRTKTKKDIVTFTAEERGKLLSYMTETGYQYDAVIRLAFATGMRKGELLALKWEDIDGDVIHVRATTTVFSHVASDGSRERKREIWDTKSVAGMRDIPILPTTKKMLSDLRHQQKLFCFRHGFPQSEYCFINNNGRLIHPNSLDESYRRLLKRAGIPYKKFHAIRHTFATEAIRAGVPVKDLQLIMGHADIATTYIYVHATEDTKRKAIELLGEMMQ